MTAPPGPTRLPRRRTDVVEDAVAWAIGVGALLLLGVAVLTGLSTYEHESARGGIESAVRTPVQAVLSATAPLVSAAHTGAGPTVRAPVTWQGPDGLPRTGIAHVPDGARAGTTVTVWIDRGGAVVQPPVTAANAALAGLLSAVGLLLAGGTLLGCLWALVRWMTAAANARRWAAEWAEVAPGWTGRPR